MKIITAFTLFFIVITHQVLAQKTLTTGLIFSSGYSITEVKKNELFLLQPEIKNSIPIELGFFTHWEPIRRIALSFEANLEHAKYKISYNDLEAFEKNWSNSEIPVFTNSFLLFENYSIYSIKLPVYIHYYLLGKFYVSGGTGIRFQLNNSLEKKSEFIFSFGVGSSSQKIGWQLFLEEPSRNKSFILPINIITKQYPNTGVECLCRSIRFSLTYNIWSK